MPLIPDEDRKQIQKILDGMTNPVKLIHRTSDCETCADTLALLEELVTISELLSLEVADAEKGERIPATVIESGGRRVQFYGIPAGYEIMSLLEAIVLLSHGESGLTPESKALLASVTDPLHIEVLVTPTCPYCPRAVRVAFQMALENPNITADAVEISEFPDLGQRYRVMGVPKTMVNGRDGVEGALPESAFVPMLLSAAEEVVS